MNEDVKYFSKFRINFIILIIILVLSEIIFRLLSDFAIFEWAFFRILLGLNILAVIVSLLLSTMSVKLSRVLTLILSFLFSLYTFLQIGFNNYLGVYMSFGTSSQLGAVTNYTLEFVSSFKWSYYLIFLPIITFIILAIIFKKKFEYPKIKIKNAFFALIVLLSLIIFSLIYAYSITASFMQNPLQQVSNKALIKYPSIPSITIKEFGTIGYCILDIKSLMFPVTEEIVEEPEPAPVEEPEPEPEPETDYTRFIDDRAWNITIENEKNKTYNSLNNYFIDREITPKNDYTGLFEDKNLIIIMMESVNDIMINEKYYPNFYKLYTEGWHFSNNYSPRNSCATGNNEMSGMIGLFSINDSCTANKYKTNTYYESIFNLFNNKGYKTSSMHNYTESYYYRSVIHKNMGSQKYYGVQALKIPFYTEYGKWASDEDFFKKVLTIIDGYDEGTKFMTWLTTVSSHQPYSVSSPFGDMYLKEFKDTKYNATTKRYMSKLKVLDNAIGILINGLEERNMLDDTVILLFADHYPYGLARSNIEKVLGYSVEKDSLADKTPLVIYNPGLKATEYEKYTTYMNLTPTVANLFNLDYDPRLYLGDDYFSDDYDGIVVFADGSWKNEHAYYNAGTSNIKNYDDFYSIDDVKKINSDITMRIKMSSLAIKNNYFNYLNKALIKNKVEDPVEEPVETKTDEVQVDVVKVDENE